MLRSVLMDENEGLYIDINLKDIEHRIDNIKKRYVLYPFPEGTMFQGYAYGVFKRTYSDGTDKSFDKYRYKNYWERGKYTALPTNNSYTYQITQTFEDEPPKRVDYHKYEKVDTRFDAIGVYKQVTTNYKSCTDILKKVFYCNRKPTLLLPDVIHCESDYFVTNDTERPIDSTIDINTTKNTFDGPISYYDFEFFEDDDCKYNTVAEFGPCFFDETGKMYARRRYLIHPTTGERCDSYVPIEYGLPLGLQLQREEELVTGYSYYPLLQWDYVGYSYKGELTRITKSPGTLHDFKKLQTLYDLRDYDDPSKVLEYSGNPPPDFDKYYDGEPMSYLNAMGDWWQYLLDKYTYRNVPEDADNEFNRIVNEYMAEFHEGYDKPYSTMVGVPTTDIRQFYDPDKFSCSYSPASYDNGFFTLSDMYKYTPEQPYNPSETYVIKRIPAYDKYLRCKGITSLAMYNDYEVDYTTYEDLHVPSRLLPNLGYFNGTTPVAIINPVMVDNTIFD